MELFLSLWQYIGEGFGLFLIFVCAAVVEFKADYPGNYVLVDHALSRLDRGAWGVMHVEGHADPSIFQGEIESGGGH